MREHLASAKALLFAALIVGSAPNKAAAQAALVYQSRYFITGFLLRATMSCEELKNKRTVDSAFNLVATPEFVAFSKAYPRTINKWMFDGSSTFNKGTMTDGIFAACRKAAMVRLQAEALVIDRHQ